MLVVGVQKITQHEKRNSIFSQQKLCNEWMTFNAAVTFRSYGKQGNISVERMVHNDLDAAT